MRKSRFSVEQIVYALKQVESRQVSVGDQCRKLGISEQTFYQWKKKYAGLGAVEARQVNQLQDENRRLKQLVADLTLDKQMLQEVLAKKESEAFGPEGDGEVARGSLRRRVATRLCPPAVEPIDLYLSESEARSAAVDAAPARAHSGSLHGGSRSRFPAGGGSKSHSPPETYEKVLQLRTSSRSLPVLRRRFRDDRDIPGLGFGLRLLNLVEELAVPPALLVPPMPHPAVQRAPVDPSRRCRHLEVVNGSDQIDDALCCRGIELGSAHCFLRVSGQQKARRFGQVFHGEVLLLHLRCHQGFELSADSVGQGKCAPGCKRLQFKTNVGALVGRGPGGPACTWLRRCARFLGPILERP